MMNWKEFMRLLRHMEEDKPNPKAQETLSRGRAILKAMQKPVEHKAKS